MNRFTILSLCIFILFGCASTTKKPPTEKPPWIDSKLGEYEFIGIATGKIRQEDAENDAFNNAVRKIAERIGIRVKAEFAEFERFEKKSEKGEGTNVYEIDIKSRIKSESRATLSGVKRKEVYREKYGKTVEGKKRYYYDMWVLVEISPKDYERAKERNEKYEKSIIEGADKLLQEAEAVEHSDGWRAYCNYETALKYLEEVATPEAAELKVRTDAGLKRLSRFENPRIELMELKGQRDLMDAYLMNVWGEELYEPSLNEGEKVRVKMNIKYPSYIYIINYDNKKKLLYLIFPNRYDKDNYLKKDGLYPEKSCFEAEKPAGLNFIRVIASSEQLDIPELNEETVRLGDDDLRRFLMSLKRTSEWDAETIDFYIKE